MKKLQPLPKFSIKQKRNRVGGYIYLGLANIFHFSFEFSILERVGLPYIFIVFHMIGVSCGSIVTFFLTDKIKPNNLASGYFTLLIGFLISLTSILEARFTPFGLFGAGFCIGGVTIGYLGEISYVPERGDPTFGGRIFSHQVMYASIIVIVYAFMNINVNFLMINIFLLVAFTIAVITVLPVSKDIQIIPQDHPKLISYFKDKKNIPKFVVVFFHGFFIINSYYVAILVFSSLGLFQFLNIYVTIFFIVYSIISIPAGYIADTIGRRATTIFGLVIQALAFLILSFIDQPNISLIILFIIILGLGYGFSYIGFAGLSYESYDKPIIGKGVLANGFFLGLGSTVGVLLGEIFSQLIETNAAYLTIVLLFIFICAIITVFQVQETLPSRSKKFIRPEVLDEEDLTLYKERKICLVCKGTATGFEVYVCTNCGVLYCLKCAQALSNLENICWACNAPIDKSKPTQPIKEVEEEITKDKFK